MSFKPAKTVTIRSSKEKRRLAKRKGFRENTDPDADFKLGKLILPVQTVRKPFNSPYKP